MNIDELPFKIGMQYENWEFDLDIVETEKYDKYRYIKNDIEKLFDFSVKYIYLYFDLEILYKVEIEFKSDNPSQQLKALSKIFKNKYGKNKMKLTKNGNTWADKNKRLKIENTINENEVVLVLIDNKYEY